MKRFHWSGVLIRCPYDVPAVADAGLLPYRTVDDYKAVQSFAQSQLEAPVLLSYGQYYRLLTAIVRALTHTLELDGPVLIEVGRALSVPMPLDLLADGVLVCDEVDSQARWWCKVGVARFAVVQSRIRRDLHELGDNSLSISLFSTADTGDPLPELLERAGLGSAFIEHRTQGAPAVQVTAAVELET